jgi:hypothetical protein
MDKNELANPRNPYSLENLQYWLQVSHDEFLLAVVNTLSRKAGAIEGWTETILNTSETKEMILTKANNRSLAEVGEIILNDVHDMKQVLVLISRYARELKKRQDS